MKIKNVKEELDFLFDETVMKYGGYKNGKYNWKNKKTDGNCKGS